MEHTGQAKHLVALLGQVDELVELGRTAQGQDEERAEAAIRALRERYPVWYSAACGALPDDLRVRFVEQFESERPLLQPRIKHFLAHPRKLWALHDKVPRWLRGHGPWQYQLSGSYAEPLFEQQRLLREASGRCGVPSDLVHAVEQLTELFRRLPQALSVLGREHRGRPGLAVTDEYDLQRVLHGVLRLHFDDVEPEETTTRRAGGSYRIDFVLRQEQIAVEAKMTRPSLGAKEIRRQLVDDMFGYRGQPSVSALVVVVYDRERRIENPAGFERDLDTDDPALPVRVVVAAG